MSMITTQGHVDSLKEELAGARKALKEAGKELEKLKDAITYLDNTPLPHEPKIVNLPHRHFNKALVDLMVLASHLGIARAIIKDIEGSL